MSSAASAPVTFSRLQAGPERTPLLENLLRSLGGHREPEALRSARLGQDVAHDPHDLAVEAEHRPAGVALVDRGIGLYQLERRDASDHVTRHPPGADVADRKRKCLTQGGPDHEDLITDGHGIGIADLHWSHRSWALQFEQCHVMTRP